MTRGRSDTSSPTLCYAQGMLSPPSGLLAALGWAAPLYKDGHDDSSRVGTAALKAWQAPWRPPL